jgi:hypothetical protein
VHCEANTNPNQSYGDAIRVVTPADLSRNDKSCHHDCHGKIVEERCTQLQAGFAQCVHRTPVLDYKTGVTKLGQLSRSSQLPYAPADPDILPEAG